MPFIPDAAGDLAGRDVGVPAGDVPAMTEADMAEQIRKIPSRETRAVLLRILEDMPGPPGPTP